MRKKSTDLMGPLGITVRVVDFILQGQKGVQKQKGSKQGCEGFRIRDKNCALIKRDCRSPRKKDLDFCVECPDFPCKNLVKLDNRYVTRYNLSLVVNLKRIKKVSVDRWFEEQQVKFSCPKCAGKMSIHDNKCYACSFYKEI